MGFRLAYLHLSLAHSNGQSQGHAYLLLYQKLNKHLTHFVYINQLTMFDSLLAFEDDIKSSPS